MSLQKLALFALTGRSKGPQNGAPFFFFAGLLYVLKMGFPYITLVSSSMKKAQDYPEIYDLILYYGR